MFNRFCKLSLILIAFVLVANSWAVCAQEDVAVSVQAKFEVLNDIQELVNKADEIETDKNGLEDKLKELLEIESLEKDYKSLKEALNHHNQTFKDKEKRGTANSDIETIISLRGTVKVISEGCSELKKQVAERTKKYEDLNKTWLDKKSFWKDLQEQNSFADKKEKLYAKDQYNRGTKNIEEALKLFDETNTDPLFSLQQKLGELDKDIKKSIVDMTTFESKLRSLLFKKTGNAMLSTKYFNEFKALLSQDKRNEFALETKDNTIEIFNNYGWVFILQLIVFIAISFYLKNVKEDFMAKFGLNFLHKNYIASSIIISILIGIPFLLENYPPMVKLVYTIFICVSTGIIICEKILNKSLKAGVALVFILYILYKIFDLANIPSVISRLILAIVSLAAGLYFLKFNDIKLEEDNPEKPENNLSLKIKITDAVIGVFLIVAFFLQIAGYSALSNHIFHITLKSVLIVLLAWIALGFLKGLVNVFLTNVFIDKYLKSLKSDVDVIIEKSNSIIGLIVAFFVFSGILSAWGFYDNAWLASKAIMSLGVSIQGTRITIGNLCWAIFLFYLILGISWFVRSNLETSFYPKRNIELGVGISINRLIYYSFIIIAIAIAMGVLGISFQSLMVIIGALGVGIGFGLQNIVNNFASGLILLFERSIKVGDIVVVNGTWGTVKHLGLRATIIQTFANAEMIVPNSDLVSGTVNNWTMTNRQTRFTVKVGVAYGTDPNLVKRVLLNIGDEHSNVLKDPAPSVVFTEFGDSSLNFELRCWVKDISLMWKTQDEVMYQIDRVFKENNIAIPFPQRDLYIKEIPTSIVEMATSSKEMSKPNNDSISIIKEDNTQTQIQPIFEPVIGQEVVSEPESESEPEVIREHESKRKTKNKYDKYRRK